MNKRKFTHVTLQVIALAYVSLIIGGLSTVIYHLAFNNPTITFGGW
jgi:hypothetical protein